MGNDRDDYVEEKVRERQQNAILAIITRFL
jgi:hypothetical protein